MSEDFSAGRGEISGDTYRAAAAGAQFARGKRHDCRAGLKILFKYRAGQYADTDDGSIAAVRSLSLGKYLIMSVGHQTPRY